MPSFPLGVLSIASYLSSKGHTVRIVDRALERSSPEKIISGFDPDLVCVTVISNLVYKDAVFLSRTAFCSGMHL